MLLPLLLDAPRKQPQPLRSATHSHSQFLDYELLRYSYRDHQLVQSHRHARGDSPDLSSYRRSMRCLTFKAASSPNLFQRIGNGNDNGKGDALKLERWTDWSNCLPIRSKADAVPTVATTSTCTAQDGPHGGAIRHSFAGKKVFPKCVFSKAFD